MLQVLSHSTIPIYEQIVSQLTFAIAAGDWEPGDLIPSARDLARQLVVNPNTVARAFQELERQGVVMSKRGLGMEVTNQGPAICTERRRALIRERLRTVLQEAVSSQLPESEIQQILREELQHANHHAEKPE